MRFGFVALLALAGCGGADSPSETCTPAVCPLGTGAYRFCSSAGAKACRYVASDNTVYSCGNCSDCSQAAQQVSAWCSGGGTTGTTGSTTGTTGSTTGTTGSTTGTTGSTTGTTGSTTGTTGSTTGTTGSTTGAGGVPLGGACTSTSQCRSGLNPSCVMIGGATVGACSADCQTDSDCDSSTQCLFQPATGSTVPGACATTCDSASDCVSGWACWISLDKQACWPVDGVAESGQALTMNCDPTVAGCTFAGSDLPGGCDRQITGSGDAGVCRRGCDIGEGTCPKAFDGTAQSCYFIDETVDSTNTPTGDKLKASICTLIEPIVADGQQCLDPSGSGQFFFDICQAGSQCLTFTPVSGMTADNECHRLCYLNSFTPPDAGPLFADGGVSAGCPIGTICTDVFGSGSSSAPTTPVGLCK